MHIILSEVVTQIDTCFMMLFSWRKLTFEVIQVIQPFIKFYLSKLVTIRRYIIPYNSYQQHAYHLVWMCDPDWQLLDDVIFTKKTNFWSYLSYSAFGKVLSQLACHNSTIDFSILFLPTTCISSCLKLWPILTAVHDVIFTKKTDFWSIKLYSLW